MQQFGNSYDGDEMDKLAVDIQAKAIIDEAKGSYILIKVEEDGEGHKVVSSIKHSASALKNAIDAITIARDEFTASAVVGMFIRFIHVKKESNELTLQLLSENIKECAEALKSAGVSNKVSMKHLANALKELGVEQML